METHNIYRYNQNTTQYIHTYILFSPPKKKQANKTNNTKQIGNNITIAHTTNIKNEQSKQTQYKYIYMKHTRNTKT